MTMLVETNHEMSMVPWDKNALSNDQTRLYVMQSGVIFTMQETTWRFCDCLKTTKEFYYVEIDKKYNRYMHLFFTK